LRVFAGEDAHAQPGRLAADLFKRHHRAADNPIPQIGVVAAIDRSTACWGEQGERLPRGEGRAGGILEHRQVKNHCVVRQSRQLIAQVRQGQVDQPSEANAVRESGSFATKLLD
jgi:hypothetical protein